MVFTFVWLDARSPLANNDVSAMPEQYKRNIEGWMERYGRESVRVANGADCATAVRQAEAVARVDGLWLQYISFARRGSWIQCVDIARIALLYLYGGVYLDTDMQVGPVILPASLSNPKTSVSFPVDDDGVVQNNFISAPAHHKMLQWLLKMFVLHSPYEWEVVDSTGPLMITSLLRAASTVQPPISIGEVGFVPAERFYPQHWLASATPSGRNSEPCYGIHTWDRSWCGGVKGGDPLFDWTQPMQVQLSSTVAASRIITARLPRISRKLDGVIATSGGETSGESAGPPSANVDDSKDKSPFSTDPPQPVPLVSHENEALRKSSGDEERRGSHGRTLSCPVSVDDWSQTGDGPNQASTATEWSDEVSLSSVAEPAGYVQTDPVTRACDLGTCSGTPVSSAASTLRTVQPAVTGHPRLDGVTVYEDEVVFLGYAAAYSRGNDGFSRPTQHNLLDSLSLAASDRKLETAARVYDPAPVLAPLPSHEHCPVCQAPSVQSNAACSTDVVHAEEEPMSAATVKGEESYNLRLQVEIPCQPPTCEENTLLGDDSQAHETPLAQHEDRANADASASLLADCVDCEVIVGPLCELSESAAAVSQAPVETEESLGAPAQPKGSDDTFGGTGVVSPSPVPVEADIIAAAEQLASLPTNVLMVDASTQTDDAPSARERKLLLLLQFHRDSLEARLNALSQRLQHRLVQHLTGRDRLSLSFPSTVLG